MSGIEWLAQYADPDGAVAFRIGRQGERVIADWPGTVRLSARRDGSDVEWTPVASASTLDLAKIRRGSGRLLLRHLTGELALHGAAIALDGRGVILLGRSGLGKSTLAAATCVRTGALLHSDDAVALNRPSSNVGWSLEPFEADHWLDEHAARALAYGGSYSGKSPHPAVSVAGSSAPLCAVIDLAFDDALALPSLSRIDGFGAAAALIPQMVRFILDESERHRKELDAIDELVAAVPIFRLRRPRTFDLLDPTIELLRTAVAATE